MTLMLISPNDDNGYAHIPPVVVPQLERPVTYDNYVPDDNVVQGSPVPVVPDTPRHSSRISKPPDRFITTM